MNLRKIFFIGVLWILFSSLTSHAQEPDWKTYTWIWSSSTCPNYPVTSCPYTPEGNTFREIVVASEQNSECTYYVNGENFHGTTTRSHCQYAPAPPSSTPSDPPEPAYYKQLTFEIYGWIWSSSTCPNHPETSCNVAPADTLVRQRLAPNETNILCSWIDSNQRTAYGYMTRSYCEFARIPYVVAVPQESPESQCSAGNPVDISTGTKFQSEDDVISIGVGLSSFTRYYNNAKSSSAVKWSTTYQRKLYPIDSQSMDRVRKKSARYFTKKSACESGWSGLKSQLQDAWAQNTTAVLNGNSCDIIQNGNVVRKLPVVADLKTEISFVPNSVQLQRENLRLSTFVHNDSVWISTSGDKGKLERISTGDIVWRYTTSHSEIEDYDAEGKLLSITSSNGMKQELFYDATSGLLSRVKDSTGRELIFSYAGNQISGVTVDGNKTTSYDYNSLGLITTVTRPDNTTRIYHYEDSRFPTYLTGITDERGKRYATWAYDAQGRAISSEHAGGAEKTLLAFNTDGSTTVTNALNKQTIYRFDDIAGARRVVKVEGQPTTNCAGANQDYTYTPEGWIASKTDWKGIKTTYTYNTVGQEISRTEAFGTTEARITTTEWHPTLYLKTKVTGPDKETIFNYDANGRLLNQSIQSVNN